MAKSKLAAMPVAGNEKLEQMNVAAPLAQSPIDPLPSAAVERDDRSEVDKWVDDNPNFDATSVAATADPKTDVEQPKTPESAPITNEPTPAPTTRPDANEAPQVTEPQLEAKPPLEAPKLEQQAAAPAPSYAPEDKIPLAEGVEWTRAQVVAALQERASLQPQAQEAEGYRKLFGMSANDAVQTWGPIVQRLATEPNTVAFLDAYLSSPEKAQYLEGCARFYDQETGAPAAAPATQVAAAPQRQYAANDPIARELADMRAWRAEQEKAAATQRITQEFAQATQRYPFIAGDRAFTEDLMLTAKALHAQDPSKGILDALALKAPLYDAVSIARSQTQQAPAPQAQAQAQPVLLGSPGASPGGTRPEATGRPRTFDNVDDAVSDWITNPPKNFQ